MSIDQTEYKECIPIKSTPGCLLENKLVFVGLSHHKISANAE